MTGRGFFARRGMALSAHQLATTLWVIGLPGSGKTFALVSWALSMIQDGRGLCFVDPHHDASDLLLRHAAAQAQHDRDLAEKVVLIRPLDPEWAVGINPLENLGVIPSERIAWFFTDLVTHILKIDPDVAARMVSLLVHTSLALAELGLTLVEIPVFLRDHAWRERVLTARIQNPEVRDYFLQEFPTDQRLRTDWMQSTLNKITRFVIDPDIRLIVGQRHSTINARHLMDKQRVVLVDLPKGHLGNANTPLFGATLMGLFQQAALSRDETTHRPQFFIYLDEWQNFITDHVQEILSESRKYGLSLILANQYLDQIPPAQRDAVLKTAGTLVSFRIGYQDAANMVREMWSPQMHRTSWRFRSLGPLPLLLPRREAVSSRDQWERYIQELTTLNPRQFWVKRRGNTPPVKQRPFEVPQPDCPPQAIQAQVTLSGTRYARRKEDIRRELEVERPRLLAELAGGQPPTFLEVPDHPPSDDEYSSVWGE